MLYSLDYLKYYVCNKHMREESDIMMKILGKYFKEILISCKNPKLKKNYSTWAPNYLYICVKKM